MGPLLLLAAIQAAQVEPARAPPLDRCQNDAGFVAFRDRLVDAVRQKDVEALRPLVDTNIQNSIGNENGGWQEFVRRWELGRPTDSGLWSELAEVLSLGCDEYDRWRIAPGNFKDLWAYDGLPPLFAVEKGAALRTKPDDDASLVMHLDYHVLLEIPDYDPDVVPKGWLHARLTDGRSGYVRLFAVRSAIDYRAAFEKHGGKWKMTSFVAGD